MYYIGVIYVLYRYYISFIHGRTLPEPSLIYGGATEIHGDARRYGEKREGLNDENEQLNGLIL